jgi:hypothetical protein
MVTPLAQEMCSVRNYREDDSLSTVLGVLKVTTFVSQQVRRATPVPSFAGPARRVAHSFAGARTSVVRSFRAFHAASAAERGQGVDTAAMLMLARD